MKDPFNTLSTEDHCRKAVLVLFFWLGNVLLCATKYCKAKFLQKHFCFFHGSVFNTKIHDTLKRKTLPDLKSQNFT